MKRLFLSITLSIGFCLLLHSQSIIKMSPESGIVGDALSVRVTTEGTQFTTCSPSAFYAWIEKGNYCSICYSHTVNNDTSVTFRMVLPHDNPTGYYNFSMSYSYSSMHLSLENGFRIDSDPTPPSLASVTQGVCKNGRYAILDLFSVNTNFNDSSIVSPYWDDLVIRLTNANDTLLPVSYLTWSMNPQVISPTHLKVEFLFPFDSPTGSFDVYIHSNRDGTMVLPAAFTLIQNPVQAQLLSCSPGSILQGSTDTLVIQGTGTAFDAGYGYPPEVTLTNTDYPEISSAAGQYNIPYYSCALNDSTIKFGCSLRYLLPPGTYDIITRNQANGTLMLPGGLTILGTPETPKILGVDPDTLYGKDSAGNINWSETVSIHTTNTHFGSYSYWPYVFLSDHFHWNYPLHDYECFGDTLIQYMIHLYAMSSGWYNLYLGNAYENLVSYHAIYIDNPTLGMDKKDKLQGIQLYPNPGSGILHLQTDTPLQTAGTLRINDPYGQEVRRIYLPAGQKEFFLDLQDLPEGLYIMHLQEKNKEYSAKLILQH